MLEHKQILISRRLMYYPTEGARLTVMLVGGEIDASINGIIHPTISGSKMVPTLIIGVIIEQLLGLAILRQDIVSVLPL